MFGNLKESQICKLRTGEINKRFTQAAILQYDLKILAMEKLAKYRQIVHELLISHATTNEPNIECQLIFDTEHDHYQILDLGWQGLNCIYACYIHLDIKDGKIWIQHMMKIDVSSLIIKRSPS
jgi:hypothetical protein